MKILFLNPSPQRCGVHQYGKRFFNLIKMKFADARYVESTCSTVLTPVDDYDVVIYNVHPAIANACRNAPFPMKAKQIGIYHDGAMNAPFDAWIFSDPGANDSANIRHIGRPLAEVYPFNLIGVKNETPTIGVSGFLGAWAPDMVAEVMMQIPEANIRLHLPASDHMDPTGAIAQKCSDYCREIAGRNLDIQHDFMSEFQLIEWLGKNDLNCYIRPVTGSSGISSALDFALAVRRPIAINKNPMFRYLHHCTPSICIEETPIRQIIKNGLIPLAPHHARNDPQVVAGEIERIIKQVAA